MHYIITGSTWKAPYSNSHSEDFANLWIEDTSSYPDQLMSVWSFSLFYLQLVWKIVAIPICCEDDGWLTRTALLPAINELKPKPFGDRIMWFSSLKILYLFSPTPWSGKPLTLIIQVMLVNTVSPRLFI